MPKTAKRTCDRAAFAEEVAEVMATGLDPLDLPPDPEGLDTPLEDAAPSTAQPTVAEKPEDSNAERNGTSDRGAVGRLVAELLADPTLGYGDIVDRVRERFPSAATTVRSVASTACVMRKRGADVPVRRK